MDIHKDHLDVRTEGTLSSPVPPGQVSDTTFKGRGATPRAKSASKPPADEQEKLKQLKRTLNELENQKIRLKGGPLLKFRMYFKQKDFEEEYNQIKALNAQMKSKEAKEFKAQINEQIKGLDAQIKALGATTPMRLWTPAIIEKRAKLLKQRDALIDKRDALISQRDAVYEKMRDQWNAQLDAEQTMHVKLFCLNYGVSSLTAEKLGLPKPETSRQAKLAVTSAIARWQILNKKLNLLKKTPENVKEIEEIQKGKKEEEGKGGLQREVNYLNAAIGRGENLDAAHEMSFRDFDPESLKQRLKQFDEKLAEAEAYVESHADELEEQYEKEFNISHQDTLTRLPEKQKLLEKYSNTFKTEVVAKLELSAKERTSVEASFKIAEESGARAVEILETIKKLDDAAKLDDSDQTKAERKKQIIKAQQELENMSAALEIAKRDITSILKSKVQDEKQLEELLKKFGIVTDKVAEPVKEDAPTKQKVEASIKAATERLSDAQEEFSQALAGSRYQRLTAGELETIKAVVNKNYASAEALLIQAKEALSKGGEEGGVEVASGKLKEANQFLAEAKVILDAVEFRLPAVIKHIEQVEKNIQDLSKIASDDKDNLSMKQRAEERLKEAQQKVGDFIKLLPEKDGIKIDQIEDLVTKAKISVHGVKINQLLKLYYALYEKFPEDNPDLADARNNIEKSIAIFKKPEITTYDVQDLDLLIPRVAKSLSKLKA